MSPKKQRKICFQKFQERSEGLSAESLSRGAASWRDNMDEGQKYNSRVSDQNGVSLLYIMLEIHHSGWEPSNYGGLLF